MRADVAEYPDAYHRERAARLGVSKRGIGDALKRLELTYKKTLNHPKTNPQKRSEFCQKIETFKKEERPLVFFR